MSPVPEKNTGSAGTTTRKGRGRPSEVAVLPTTLSSPWLSCSHAPAAGVLAPVGFVLPMSVGAVLMSLSTIVVALNAQLLRRLDLDPRNVSRGA